MDNRQFKFQKQLEVGWDRGGVEEVVKLWRVVVIFQFWGHEHIVMGNFCIDFLDINVCIQWFPNQMLSLPANLLNISFEMKFGERTLVIQPRI